MKTKVLPGGVKRIVHVIAKTLQENMASGEHKPMIGVRLFDHPEKLETYRHVQILGPSDLFHTPNRPLPDTNGRGICYLVTEAPIRLWMDDGRVSRIGSCQTPSERQLRDARRRDTKRFGLGKSYERVEAEQHPVDIFATWLKTTEERRQKLLSLILDNETVIQNAEKVDVAKLPEIQGWLRGIVSAS